MKLRYLFGVPFLFMLAMSGQNVLFEALVIGILAGFTDISRDNNNNIRPS